MSIFNDQTDDGNLWIRGIDNTIGTGSELLSAIIEKYKSINTGFYNNLIDNNIINIDMFYDCIFIETDIGYIIEKYYIDDNNKIKPLNNNNFLTLKRNTNTKYWFDEKTLKVYFFDIVMNNQERNSLIFNFKLTEFDCKSGLLYLKLDELVYVALINALDWGIKVPVVEPPVVSYNEFTKTFNYSFIFRNNTLNIAIMSLMIDFKTELELTDINAFIPFCKAFGEVIHISR